MNAETPQTWLIDVEVVVPLAHQIEALLTDVSRCVADLTTYFHPTGAFSGGAFERLEAVDDNIIDSQDILALTMLSVTLPGLLARDLLFDMDLKAKVSGQLALIRANVDLWDAGVEPDLDSANDLWFTIKDRAGTLKVGADDAMISKLLAHKRPRLIPISDSVVKESLRLPGDLNRWTAYRSILQTRPDSVAKLDFLRLRMRAAPTVSLLRVLDVVTWMRFRRNHAS